MSHATFLPPREPGHASRFHGVGETSRAIGAAELLILIGAGLIAACAVAFLPLQLRIPGHAILKAALPIVCGVALAPRRFAGTVAGISAGLTAEALLVTGWAHLPAAALTSLLAIGPAIDIAKRGARSAGWPLYLRFAAAGLAANAIAFAVRWSTAALALDGFNLHMLPKFGLGVLASFAICGIVAGLISAIICYRDTNRQ